MDIENFIRMMPKAELNLHLGGLFRKETLLTIAEQNEIPASTKDFDEWVELLDEPDYTRLDEIVETVSSWLLQPDDLTRMIYDAGVDLSKQNVKYAEILVHPSLYMHPNMSFEVFIETLDDGRDRVKRGWGVEIRWILTINRDEPRRADEMIRWAASPTGKNGQIVGFGLVGPDDAQPVGQFERAFHMAEDKGIPTVVQAGTATEAEGVLEVLNELHPSRLLDGWGSADAPDVLKIFSSREVPLVVSMARALCSGWVETYADYPLRRLYDENVRLVISADMPSLYHTTLSDEYLAVVEHGDFSLEELEELALNALHHSFLSHDEKVEKVVEFRQEYERLHAEDVASEAG